MKIVKKRLKKFKILRNLNRAFYRLNLKRIIRQPIQAMVRLKIADREDLIANSKYKTFSYSEEEMFVEIGEAYYLDDLPTEVKQNLAPKSEIIKKPYVFEVENGSLVGDYATAFTEDGKFIRESSFPYYTQNISWHTHSSVSSRTLLFQNLYPTKTADAVCSIVNAWNGNYFHWFVDALTRLEGLEFYEQATGKKPLLIVNPNLTKWQIESLKLMGRDWVEWQGGKLKANKLIIPTYRKEYREEARVYRYPSPQACKWVANKILNALEEVVPPTCPLVYISRSKAIGRQVINEQEVIEKLSKFGFETFVLEDMPFTAQVKLFSQAKIVVSPHGAGLTNIIFSKDLTVFELFGKDLLAYATFSEIARGLGFKYACLDGDKPKNEMRNWDGNMIVDINKLEKLLKKVL